MALTRVLLFNIFILAAIAIGTCVLCRERSNSFVLLVIFVIDTAIFWQELHYYESSLLFVFLLAVQLLLAFLVHKSNRP